LCRIFQPASVSKGGWKHQTLIEEPLFNIAKFRKKTTLPMVIYATIELFPVKRHFFDDIGLKFRLRTGMLVGIDRILDFVNGSRERNEVKRPDHPAFESGHCVTRFVPGCH